MSNPLTHTWTDVNGQSHTITTPRGPDVVRRHREAVAFWEGVFPPA